MKETLEIRNFGGIKHIKLDINEITVLIGPQASGKSICAKLLFFFKKYFYEIFHYEKASIDDEFKHYLINMFKTFFNSDSWLDDSFKVEYKAGGFSIAVEKEYAEELKIEFSNKINNQVIKYRNNLFDDNDKQDTKQYSLSKALIKEAQKEEFIKFLHNKIAPFAGLEQLLIPAGRSFFYNIQSSIFNLINRRISIDPFLMEFGSIYENHKQIVENLNHHSLDKSDNYVQKQIDSLLRGKFIQEIDSDYIIQNDGRKIDISYASSGQQELLPLTVILRSINIMPIPGNGAMVYIEEPEAHLFPSAQKHIVELISSVYNLSVNKLQFFITTHSPYILAAFNNLIQAGDIIKSNPDKKKEVHKIVPEYQVLNPKKSQRLFHKGWTNRKYY